MACCNTLLKAIDSDHPDCLKDTFYIPKWILSTFDIPEYKNTYENALILSIQLGKTQCVSKLISLCSKEILYDALTTAAKYGHHKIVRQFVHIKYGPTKTSPLHEAAKNGHVKCIKILLKNEHDATTTNKYGHTPLHLAAISGNVECVKLLLQHNKGCAYVEDEDNYTPLHIAVHYNHLECVQILINIMGNRVLSFIGEILSIAIMRNSYSCLLILLNLNLTAQHLVDAIECAAKNNWTLIRPLLVKTFKYGPIKELVTMPTSNGSTILHQIARTHTIYLDIFISMGADINVRDKDGNTPLYEACCNNNCDSVVTLLQQGATAYDELGWFSKNAQIKLIIANPPVPKNIYELISELLGPLPFSAPLNEDIDDGLDIDF